MTINQLFRKKPSKDLVIEFLNIYGLDGFEEGKTFTRNCLNTINIEENLINFVPKLKEFYLPCKRKIYLQDITIKKSITILRQILKLFDYLVKSNERYIKGEKIIVYHIKSLNVSKKENTNNDKCVISFD
jgi:hypothetical protein